MRVVAAGLGILLLLGSAPRSVSARQIDTAACEAVAASAFCRAASELATVMMVRSGGIAAAGNPVAGTASTMGRRLPGVPRITFSARRSAGSADLPAEAGAGSSTSASAWSGEVAVGLLEGLSPLPTFGGLLSLDLLGSVSLVQFPSADGFRTRAPSSFAVGARLGVFRESFTLPGISVSAMYRQTGRMTYGDIGLRTRDLHVRLDRSRTWSARAVAGKRIGLFGFTAGAGFDRHSGRGRYRVREDTGEVAEFEFRSLEADRSLLFAGASWTLLVFNFSGEVGWQLDAGRDEGAAGSGGLFAGLAARLTF